MKRISITQRLIGTFFILCSIVAVLGWLGVYQMEKLSQESESIITKRWVTLQASFQAISYSYQNNRLIMQIFLNENPNTINMLLLQRKHNSEHITNYLKQICSNVDSEKEKNLLKEIEARRKPYVDSYLRALNMLLREKNPTEARTLFTEESIPLLVAYQNAWKNFVDVQQNTTEMMVKQSKDQMEHGRWVFLCLTVLTIVLTLLIAMVVTFEMNREISIRQNAELELRRAGDELDDRVRIRTAELLQANEKLQDEIAQRKAVEVRLVQEEKKYQDIFESCPEGIFQSSMDGRLLRVNSATAQMFGYASPEEMVSLITDVATQFYANPTDRAEFRRRVDSEPVVRNYEFQTKRKDGSIRWTSITARRIIPPDGVVPIYLGFMMDVTEQRKAQQERDLMEIHLRQSQKLESVGQLAAGIAHEINTPIQYVGDNLRFLEDAFGSINSMAVACKLLTDAAHQNQVEAPLLASVVKSIDDTDIDYLRTEIPAAIHQSLDGIQRVANIVGAMKEFSHPGSKEKIPVDINRAIQTTVTVARNEWKYVADVRTQFDPSLPLVPCLPDELNQVFLNLIVNAAQAINEAAKARKTNEKGLITIATSIQKNVVEIRVSDTGTGIPDEIKHRIFEPFFTTKEVGKGTGQGLAISRSAIVNKHGGELAFESVPGKGATFIVRLPIQAANGKTENKS